MLKLLQQGLMAIHLALEELALPHRIAAFEDTVLLKDFGFGKRGASPAFSSGASTWGTIPR